VESIGGSGEAGEKAGKMILTNGKTEVASPWPSPVGWGRR